jgi:hypothetical protein
VSLASSRSARTRRDVKTTSRRRPTGLEEQNEENIARWEVRRHSRRRHARARDPPRVPRGDSSRVVASVATRAVARRPRARVPAASVRRRFAARDADDASSSFAPNHDGSPTPRGEEEERRRPRVLSRGGEQVQRGTGEEVRDERVRGRGRVVRARPRRVRRTVRRAARRRDDGARAHGVGTSK